MIEVPPEAVEAFCNAATAQVRTAIDPGVPVDAMTTLASILAEQLVTRRATTSVINGFAAGALTLAALGLYGLLTLLVASGARETGIRLALGSSPSQEAGRVVRNALDGQPLYRKYPNASDHSPVVVTLDV